MDRNYSVKLRRKAFLVLTFAVGFVGMVGSLSATDFMDVTDTALPTNPPTLTAGNPIWGDIDNDGAIDIVVTNNNGAVRLLLNQSRFLNRNHWLLVRLEAVHGNRFGVGAKVEVRQRGRKLLRRAHGDSSYLSANDIRVHFGLGEDAKIEEITVHWPSGECEAWDRIQADRIVTIRQGSGRRLPGQG